jgi:tRNA-splicing ligase RtcB
LAKVQAQGDDVYVAAVGKRRWRKMKMLDGTDRVLCFLDPNSIEPEAQAQLRNTARLPFIHGHVAAMPDCHLGKGATVGSVIATKGAIVPAAVGVDIGCGMIAVRTKFSASDLPESLKDLREGIERRIALGAGQHGHNRTLQPSAEQKYRRLTESQYYDKDRDYSKIHGKWHLQIGSLGGGNHFIEICLDEQNRVWAVLHSGSRGIGNKLASTHIDKAKGLMKKWHISLPDPDLAYLVESTPEFHEYMRDLLWAQEYALANREEMMDRVMTELSYTFFKEGGHEREVEVERINCHHNFTQREHHFGENVWITRKGAIQMRAGQKGVIPGSMGTRSYIVSGLQNPASFHSAPHGAGRRFSRNEARRRFTMEDFDEAMKGIEHRRSTSLIDELPGAYKPIDEVMENAKDLVEVEHELRQVCNVKGD